MACVRSLKHVRVASRSSLHAEQFARKVSSAYSFSVEAVPTAEAAVRDADLIITVTTSHEPVVRSAWLSPGVHINAVGTYSPKAREIDGATMARASLFVDRRESALNEAGDYLIAAAEGVIGPESIRAELGEVLIGAKTGRQADDEITLFKSLGIAVEDLAAAQYVFEQAQLKNLGTWVEF
ncbi:MAG TPA: hypothetical protein VIV66_12930, partial [Pyrinomonadaceae bacterium]